MEELPPEKMKVNELKEELRRFGLSLKGRKVLIILIYYYNIIFLHCPFLIYFNEV